MSLTIELLRSANLHNAGRELVFELRSKASDAAKVEVVCTTDDAEGLMADVKFSFQDSSFRVPLAMHWSECESEPLYKAFYEKTKLTAVELNCVHRYIASFCSRHSPEESKGHVVELPVEDVAVKEEGKVYTLGELLAMKQKINAHYNLMQGERCTAADIAKLYRHIEQIKRVLTAQIKDGVTPKFVIDGNGSANASAMFHDFDLKNLGSRMHPKVKYYPVWESLMDWAKSQGLILAFASDFVNERDGGSTKKLTIIASPSDSVNIKDLSLEELFALYEEGRKHLE